MNPRSLLRVVPATRSFATSARALSHVGSSPIPIPPKVEITYPAASIDPETPVHLEAGQRFVEVKGPKGQLTVPILPPVILTPPAAGKPLEVKVHDETAKTHRSVWGLTRGLLNNAVKGVSEGYTTELRLVGVGYRAAVEPIPKVFRDIQASIPRIARPAKPGAPPYTLPPLPVDRLNIKLGFAHPVLIDIPHDIKVTTPQPTKIVLEGIDNQKLGRFAAKIRRWRKPEPYRGKVSGNGSKQKTGGRRRRMRESRSGAEAQGRRIGRMRESSEEQSERRRSTIHILRNACCKEAEEADRIHRHRADNQGIFIGDETIKLKEIKKK